MANLLGELEERKRMRRQRRLHRRMQIRRISTSRKKQEILNNISSAKEHVQVAFESRGTGGDADAK